MLKVELQDVTKVFPLAGGVGAGRKEKIAVDGISLLIKEGERVGIIGPNGAGKSTLLQMICGITEPTLGNVSVEGNVTCVLTLGVGLREEATGRENVYLEGEAKGLSRKQVDQYIERVIAFSEIGEFIDRPVRIYSTGMKSRLSFSMLVVMEPEILVIDEALSAGDIFFSRKASRKIRDVTESGGIAIIVSHGLESIVEMCDRCLWIENGCVVMDGEPDLVTGAYREKCRHEDHEEWQRQHLRQNGESIYCDGWKLGSPAYFQSSSNASPHNLSTGKDTEIVFQISKPRGFSGSIRCRIEKSDGFCIEDREVATLGEEGLGEASGRLRFLPMILGAGRYLLTLSLFSGDMIAATLSTIFEVSAPVHSGGRALLAKGAEVKIKRS